VNLKCAKEAAASGKIQDFPFLRQHKPAKGTITMENGDMAAVCLDCFETLKNQFVEQATKYGIPVERRQYNWMQIPPPPEEAATHLATPKERLEKQIITSGDLGGLEGGGVAQHTSQNTQGSRKDCPSTATSQEHIRRQQQLQVEQQQQQQHQQLQQQQEAHHRQQAEQQQQQQQQQQHGRGSRVLPQQASYAAALRDLAQAQGNPKDTRTSSASPLLPPTSLADIQKGFGEAIAASMFSAPGLVRAPPHGSTAAASLVPPILPMLRLPALPYTHSPFHHPSPYSSYDPLAYRLAPMPLASHLPVVAPPLHHPAPAPPSSGSRPPAPGNGVAPPCSSVARTREGRYPSG